MQTSSGAHPENPPRTTDTASTAPRDARTSYVGLLVESQEPDDINYPFKAYWSRDAPTV